MSVGCTARLGDVLDKIGADDSMGAVGTDVGAEGVSVCVEGIFGLVDTKNGGLFVLLRAREIRRADECKATRWRDYG